MKTNGKRDGLIYFFLLGGLSFIISLCFYSNPFSPDKWGTDSGVFMYIAKAFGAYGQIPYRDVFDHKGPLIYLINYPSTFFKDISLGLYLTELAFLLACTVLIFRIARLYTNSKSISFITTCILMVVYQNYIQTGNFSEEYALFFMLVSLYLFSAYILKEIDHLPKRKIYGIGLCLGCVLMLRPNMIALWIAFGVSIAVYFIIQKRFLDLLKSFGLIVAGAASVVLPFVIFFASFGALGAFYDAYWVFNIKYISKDISAGSFVSSVKSFWTPLIILSFIQYAIHAFRFKNRPEKRLLHLSSLLHLGICLLLLSLSVYQYGHYALITIPCLILGTAVTLKMACDTAAQNMKLKGSRRATGAAVLLLIVLLLLFQEGRDPLTRIQQTAPLNQETKENPITALIKTNTDADDEIFVAFNYCRYYLDTDRKASTRYPYQYPIADFDPKIEQTVFEEFEANPPKMAVLPGQTKFGETAYGKKLAAYFDTLVAQGLYDAQKFDAESGDFVAYIRR